MVKQNTKQTNKWKTNNIQVRHWREFTVIPASLHNPKVDGPLSSPTCTRTLYGPSQQRTVYRQPEEGRCNYTAGSDVVQEL